MRISILFLVIAGVMLIGWSWLSIRDSKPDQQRSHFVTATVGLLGLAQLTQDVVLPVIFDSLHIGALFGAALAVWAIIVPVFRARENQIDSDAMDLRK